MSSGKAPPELEIVRSFVNTYDVEQDVDEIDSPDKLGAWLEAQGLSTGPLEVSAADIALAQSLRESLRALLRTNNGAPVDSGATSTLNETAERFGISLRFDGKAVRLEVAAEGVRGALGRLLTMVAVAMYDNSWSRLKACRDHDCEWVFYDASKNRSGNWCSMRVCGNRNKARAFRERQKTADA